ncbi:MAG: CHAT domain-containing protein [Gloeotrichia echinulata DVL01]|nr:CHAT domain-containing protein [Gloeotrichia echinulata DEX184]
MNLYRQLLNLYWFVVSVLALKCLLQDKFRFTFKLVLPFILGILTFLFVITVIPAQGKNSVSVRLIPSETPVIAHSHNTLPLTLPNQGQGAQDSQTIISNQVNSISPPNLQSPISLLEQGKHLYNLGRFAEAAELWQQVHQVSGKELSTQALSYNYLAIVYQDLGLWQAAKTAISQSLALLNNSKFKTPDAELILAQVLNTQGSLQLNTGHGEDALATWKQAEKHYRSAKDGTGIILSQINQSQALQTLGFYRQARTILEQMKQDLAALPDSLLKINGLHSLGRTLQMVGDLQESEAVLSASLTIAKKLDYTANIGEILFSLGNTARAKLEFKTALKFYQQVQDTAKNPQTQLEALLNQLSILVYTKQTTDTLALIPQIQQRLANLPPSHGVIYAQVNFAASLIKIDSMESGIGSREIAELLARAVQQARELQDPKAESYALGELGHLYEQTQQWSEALSLTQQALSIALRIQAADIGVTWYWQQGRILKAQGEVTQAIAAYEEAANILQSLRQDLVAVNPDVQFSFREQVEPVYRQLVQLLLHNVDSLPKNTQQKYLQRSREVIEGLQLAELDNFFREACLTYKTKPIERIDPKAAVIYPIILDQRLEVILSLPGQPLQHYGTDLGPATAEKVFNQLRQSLNPVFLPGEILAPAQQVYDWLLRPATVELERQGIKTLVFVLDGFLRSLPMAILHDGQHYLVEDYNIALTPGLQLLESRSLSPQQFKVLAGGLATARQGFSTLPGVEQEINQIQAKISAKVLLNQEFTRRSFQQRVEAQPFSVVHLATHGQFSSKAQDTFLLTWDDRINVKDLDQLLTGVGKSATQRLREPIELLVLSACQTAKGDNRATLGLAGVAVRSGARSTLATLWSVQDQSTSQLIAEFYRLLTQSGMTKAEALRQAQLSLLNSAQYKHPYYWSAFVLVGNWR